MKFVFSGVQVATDDPYYDLFDGGYIDPSEMIGDPEQAEAVEDALDLIREFLRQAEGEGVLEVG